jgi:hypothetical protein
MSSRTKKKLIVLFFAAFAIVLLVGLPSLGADSVDILTSTRDNMNANRAWWTSLWELNYKNTGTFAETPSLSNAVLAQITQWFFAISLIIYILLLMLKMCLLVDRGAVEILKNVFPFVFTVILVITLMTNNSSTLKLIIFDLRTTVNAWPALLLDANIIDSTPRQALTDTLVTDQAQLKIAVYLQQCKPLAPTGTAPLPTEVLGPNIAGPTTLAGQQAASFRDCMTKVAQVAKEELDKAGQNCVVFGQQVGSKTGDGKACQFINRFGQKVTASIDSIIKTEEEKLKNGGPGSSTLDLAGIGFLDFIGGMTANAAFRPALAGTQWLYVSFLELAMFLTSLGALIIIPVALIPGRANIAIGTLMTFLTIGLAQLMYVITISTVALLLSNDQSTLFSDMRFPMALGIFAPVLSFAVVAVGGKAAAHAFMGASFTTANIFMSAGGSILGNAGVAISRSSYGRR